MNKYVRYITAGLLILPLSAMAANSLTEKATPVQSYQTAHSANTTSKSSEPEWVSASKYLRGSTAAKKPTSSDTPVKQLSESANTPTDIQSVRMLEAELTQINQNNLLFQQKVDEQLIELNNKNRLLEQQYRQLAQAIALLNQKLVAFQKAMTPSKNEQVSSPQSPSSSTFGQWVQLLKDRLGPVGFKIALPVAAILLILLFWIIWPRNKKEKKEVFNRDIHEKDALDDTETEYDYMGSEEGIPAKLDLARTYIAMEDYNTARKVLAEVSQHGDQSHKVEAQAMLDEIPAES